MLRASKGYRGPISDHFDGKNFFNYGGEAIKYAPTKGQRMSIPKWLWKTLTSRTSWSWIDNKVSEKPVERVNGDEIKVTYIGHATILIQTQGLNIITDPVWSMRASPFTWGGPRRYRLAGLKLEELPPIDVILLSHNHYDHCDIKTLKYIFNKWHPVIYTGLGNSEYLRSYGIDSAVDVDWWSGVQHSSSVKIVCVPAQHFSSRSFSDRNRTLWCGFVVETLGGNIYFAGDTGYGPWVDKLWQHYNGGNFKLAFLPIGAYLPEWFMKPVHMSPDEASHVHKKLKIKTSVGIHFGTFRLAEDGQDEAPRAITDLAQKEQIDFRILKVGEVESF